MEFNCEPNGLDLESIAIAQYYFYIRRIKKQFDSMKVYIILIVLNNRIREAVCIPCRVVVDGLHMKWLPLHTHIFQRYENEQMNWNEFFQYIMYFCFAPMASIIHTVLCIITNSDGNKIAWNDIIQFSFVLRTSSKLKQDAFEYFTSLDLNKDNFLTLTQFYQFINKYYILFDPLFQLHLNLIQKYCLITIIPILERKLNIRAIKSYQFSHKNKYPPEPCSYQIKRLLYGLPHSNRYDYEPVDPDRNQFNDISYNIIKHYKSNFKKNLRFTGNIKLIVQISKIDLLIKIDNYYLQYRRSRSRKSSIDNSATSLASAINANNTSQVKQDNDSDTNKSTSHSILRKSTYTFNAQLQTPNNHKLSISYKTSVFSNNNNNNNNSDMALVNKRQPTLSLKDVDLPGLIVPNVKPNSTNMVNISVLPLCNDLDEENENETENDTKKNNVVEF